MDFDEPHGRPESATIEHLHDATLGGIRQQKHRRLAHGACNWMRNELRMEAEKRFRAWIDARIARARAVADVTPGNDHRDPGHDDSSTAGDPEPR